MPLIDLSTTFFILGCLNLILSFMTWIILSKQSNSQVILWSVAGMLAGIGMILFSRYEHLPNWVVIDIGIILVLLTYFFRIQALRLDLHHPLEKLKIFLMIVGIFVIFEWLNLGLKNELLRAEFVSVVGAALMSYLALLAWRISQQEQSRSALWISGVYALLALAMALRLVALIKGQQPIFITEPGPSHIFLAIVLLISSVVLNFGYVGLALDRSRNRQKATEAQEKAERQIYETNLRNSEQRFRDLFSKNTSIMLLLNPQNGRIEDANTSAVKFYGYPKTQLLNMTIYDINQALDHDISTQLDKVTNQENISFVFQHRLASGNLRDVEVFPTTIFAEGKHLVFSIIHDITERKANEAQLHHERNFINTVLNTVGAVVMVIDREGNILRFNHAAEKTTGYRFEDIKNQSYFWKNFLPREDHLSTLSLF